MRVFVFGSLLLHTLDAQSTLADSGDGTLTALDASAPLETLQPLVTPGVSTDFFRTATDNATSSGVDFATLDLPTGTADVIVESSPTASPIEDDLGEPFGAGETPGAGIEMGDLSAFDFPTSTPVPTLADASAVSVETAIDIPIQNGFVAPSSTSPSEFGLGAPAIPVTDSFPTNIISTDDGMIQSDHAPTATGSIELPDLPDATDAASMGTGVGAAAAPDENSEDSDVAPEDTDSSGEDNAPLENENDNAPMEDEDTDSSSLLDDGPTAPVDDLTVPDATPGSVIGSGRSALDAASVADDGGDSEDASDYGGQYYEDECPWYCYESNDYYDSADAGDDEDYRDSDVANDSEDDGDSEDGDQGDNEIDEPMFSRLLHRFRRRQNVASSNRGFAALKWPGDRRSTLCPASCYYTTTSYTTSSPTPLSSMANPWDTHSRSRRPWPRPSPTPTPSSASAVLSHSHGRHPWPHPHPTLEPWPSSPSSDSGLPSTTPDMSIPDDFVSTPSGGYDSNTSDEWIDTTTTATRTTFVTSTTTTNSPYGSNSADYTGDSLDSICPMMCNPTDNLANKCDITSSCTTTGSGKYYCACRAGFRSSAWNAKDFSKQFRFDGQPYVYTAEGVVCDLVCSDQICSEVISRPQCQ
jgi:hypothetical protein